MANDPISEAMGFFADILQYPTTGFAERLNPGVEAMNSEFPEVVEALREFVRTCLEYGQGRMEELYTNTFDLQAVCHPYIGHHLFGESYKRGTFMAKLVEGYGAFGYTPGQELPDHISVALQFLSLGPEARGSEFGRGLLTEGMQPALEKMAQSMESQAGNPYRAVFKALSQFLLQVFDMEKAHA